MRRFNPERELRKIQHGNRNKIVLFAILLLLVSAISYSFAIYQVRYNKRIIYTKVAPFSNKDINLAVLIDGSPADNFPEKNDGKIYEKIDCGETKVKAYWDYDKWALVLETNEKANCNVYFREIKENEVIGEFLYNGSIQKYNVPKSGVYKLEVWGAQGGIINDSNSNGGKGGYSVGAVKLTSGTTLYIVVGGHPANKSVNGGYNGGGNGLQSLTYYGVGGGGATHIASTTGTLEDIGVNKKSQIYIVAGGGGGGALGNQTGHGGAGGGTSGISGTGVSTLWFGSGGSQSSAGSNSERPQYTSGAFGKGGNCNYEWGAGGGGGYYGGGASTFAGAGGGSGYIGGVISYGGVTAKTLDGNASFPNTAGTANETGHEGNGYAKITYVGQ